MKVIFSQASVILLMGGHAWFYSGGVVRGFIQGGMHGFIYGACMVLFGGACMVLFGGRGACVVLFGGGMHGFFSFFRYNEIWSMSGRYASYWNAFLIQDNFYRH